NDVFIGDSIRVDDDGSFSYTHPIGNRITFMARRRGYKNTYFEADLFPGLMLHNDVVMLKEDRK
ncbi:MAG: hypothetical protein ACM3RX_08650, partial [Methanococcaceae archaeon]